MAFQDALCVGAVTRALDRVRVVKVSFRVIG